MNVLHRLLAVPFIGLGLLVACGGDGPTSVQNTGIIVSGVVKDRSGEPISGASVLITGKGPVTTAPDGRFSLTGVTVPYDIIVFERSQNTVEIHKGLTRSDPILGWWIGETGPTQTATISGTVPPADPVTTVFFVGPTIIGGGRADPTTGVYSFTVSWTGSTASQAGVLHLLRWQPQGALPASYSGYASKPLTISGGGTFAGNDFAASDLIDPPEQSIAGSVSPPQGYTLNSRALYLEFGEAYLYWSQVSNPTQIPFGIIPNSFTYTVPAIAGVRFNVYADGYDGGWTHFLKRDIPGNSTGVVVPLEETPHLIGPADSATAIDATTVFSWSQGGGTGVNILSVIPDDAANPKVYELTTAAQATLPDLAGTGVQWPAGAGYHWFVQKDFPIASVNEAAGDWFWNPDTGDRGWTGSDTHAFTTRTPAGTALRTSAVGEARTAVQAVPERSWMRGLHIISASRASDRRLP